MEIKTIFKRWRWRCQKACHYFQLLKYLHFLNRQNNHLKFPKWPIFRKSLWKQILETWYQPFLVSFSFFFVFRTENSSYFHTIYSLDFWCLVFDLLWSLMFVSVSGTMRLGTRQKQGSWNCWGDFLRSYKLKLTSLSLLPCCLSLQRHYLLMWGWPYAYWNRLFSNCNIDFLICSNSGSCYHGAMVYLTTLEMFLNLQWHHLCFLVLS